MKPEDESARARTAERIAEVRGRFVAGLDARLAALCDLAHAAASADPVAASAAADSLRLGLHNLAGGAPTLGLTEVGRRAAGLERLLIEERSGDGRISAKAAAELAAAIEGLSRDAAPT